MFVDELTRHEDALDYLCRVFQLKQRAGCKTDKKNVGPAATANSGNSQIMGAEFFKDSEFLQSFLGI